MSEIGHNLGEIKGLIKSIISRVENLESEKKGLAEDVKEVFLEAKLKGFDIKVLRMVLKERKMSREARKLRDDVLDEYMAALEDFE